ncbi:hypothetical protein COO60DRAFT_1486617, partial [Scenedesmus sp. NREL 46B-D3]
MPTSTGLIASFAMSLSAAAGWRGKQQTFARHAGSSVSGAAVLYRRVGSTQACVRLSSACLLVLRVQPCRRLVVWLFVRWFEKLSSLHLVKWVCC